MQGALARRRHRAAARSRSATSATSPPSSSAGRATSAGCSSRPIRRSPGCRPRATRPPARRAASRCWRRWRTSRPAATTSRCVVGVELMRNVRRRRGRSEARRRGVGAARDRGRRATRGRSCSATLGDEYDRRYGLRRRAPRARSREMQLRQRAPQPERADARLDASAERAFDADDERQPASSPVGIRRHDCSPGHRRRRRGGARLASASPGERAADRRAERCRAIAGWGHRTARMALADKLADSNGSPYVFPHVRGAITDAFERAGIDGRGRARRDRDATTASRPPHYMAIDHFGLTPPGESLARDRGRHRRLRRQRCPINPSGGLIGVRAPRRRDRRADAARRREAGDRHGRRLPGAGRARASRRSTSAAARRPRCASWSSGPSSSYPRVVDDRRPAATDEQPALDHLGGHARRPARRRALAARRDHASAWRAPRASTATRSACCSSPTSATGRSSRCKIFHHNAVFMLGPEANHYMLVSHASNFLWRDGHLRDLIPLLGDGLLTIDGAFHRTHRKLMLPAFHRERIEAATAVIEEEVDRGAGGASGPARSIDLYDWTRRRRAAGRDARAVRHRPRPREGGRAERGRGVRVGAVVLRARLPAADPARAAHAVRPAAALARAARLAHLRRDRPPPGDRRARRRTSCRCCSTPPTRRARRSAARHIRDEVMTLLFAGPRHDHLDGRVHVLRAGPQPGDRSTTRRSTSR